jgi:hypothetical protein
LAAREVAERAELAGLRQYDCDDYCGDYYCCCCCSEPPTGTSGHRRRELRKELAEELSAPQRELLMKENRVVAKGLACAVLSGCAVATVAVLLVVYFAAGEHSPNRDTLVVYELDRISFVGMYGGSLKKCCLVGIHASLGPEGDGRMPSATHNYIVTK